MSAQSSNPAALAFDALAADYDGSFSATPLGNALRDLVWSRLQVRFASARRVLDLGCGTGEDALHLAGGAELVVGIDASEGMIRMARAKVSAGRQGARVEFHCAPMEQLDSVLGGQRFDAVLSNFGALNCIADLPEVARSVARHVEPGGALLWVLMGRHVPWEWLWFASRGQPRRAFRRLRTNGVQWRGLRVYYPRPADVVAMLQSEFSVDAVRPVGCILPPSYAGGWLNGRPRLLAALARLDRAAQRIPTLARIADHYLIEATRGSVSPLRAAA